MASFRLQALSLHWTQVRTGLGRFRTWYELCRAPASLAVVADPLAGALLVGAGWGHMPYAFSLMLGAFCIHAGAVVLNDWHDFKTDRVENPDRPIACGQVGRWQGLFAAVVLLCVGGTLFSVPGHKSGQMGLVLVSLVLLHEFIMKGAPVGKAAPAAARGLLLAVGMMLVPVAESAIDWPMRVFLVGVLSVYTLAAVILAQRPADAERRAFAISAAVVAGVSLAALAMTRIFFPGQASYPSAAVWIGLLLALVGYPVFRAIWRPSEQSLKTAAWAALLGSILVDAAAVAFVRGLPLSLVVAGVIPPVVYTRRLLGRPTLVPEPGVVPEDDLPDDIATDAKGPA